MLLEYWSVLAIYVFTIFPLVEREDYTFNVDVEYERLPFFKYGKINVLRVETTFDGGGYWCSYLTK